MLRHRNYTSRRRNNRITDKSHDSENKRFKKLCMLPLILFTLTLFCWRTITFYNPLTNHSNHHYGIALLRSRWERLLLFLSEPKTKISKKTNDGVAVEDIIVLVTGEANGFKDWYENLKDVHSPNLHLVYGSYDTEVEPLIIVNEDIIKNSNNNEENTNNEFFHHHTMFIPGKTWTEGRNLLAAEALRKEKLRGKEFSYWFFLDGDVKPICHPTTDKIYGAVGSCWQKVFNFLASEAVPEKASTVVLPSYLKDGFVATSNVNGFNAAFKRSHVPYLLPYATLRPGFSEKISQAANMCIISSCMTNSVVFVPLIYSTNMKHRDYSRSGYTINNIHTAIIENFHNESIGFIPCHGCCGDWNKISYYTEGEFSGAEHQLLGPFPSSEELNDHMSYTNTSYCVPMLNRFTQWGERVLSDSPHPGLKPNTEDDMAHPGLKPNTEDDMAHPALKPNIEDDMAHPALKPNIEDDMAKKDIVVMVMGEASAFEDWLERLQHITGVNLTFIFASSYGEEVKISPNNNDASDQDFNFQRLYIHSETWTEGRNLLAEEALRKEKLQGKEFSYWLFLDDDIEPVCYPGHPGSVQLLGAGSCWQQIFNFISGVMVPKKASTIILPFSIKEGFASTSNADASFAAFKRESVPYLIPYATLRKASNKEISQAANFCVMSECFTNSGVYVPFVTAKNTESRPHTRGGFNIEDIHKTITRNFHNISANFTPCHDWNMKTFHEQGEDGTGILGPFKTADDLDQHIPSHKNTLCAPLRHRFTEWEKNAMAAPASSITS